MSFLLPREGGRLVPDMMNPRQSTAVLQCPCLNIKLATLESSDKTAKLAAVLTDLTADVLTKKRGPTVEEIEYTAPERWFIGGASLDGQKASSFYHEVRVTEGTNTKTRNPVT